MSSSDNSPNKGAYYRAELQPIFEESSITTHFTHVYYAFLYLNEKTFEIEVDGATNKSLASFIKAFSDKDCNIRKLFSLGGGSEKATEIFAEMAKDSGKRESFIQSTLNVAKTYKFDGVDLDWEFPRSEEEMGNFKLLLEEWRKAVDIDSEKDPCEPKLLLSAATYYSPYVAFNECRYPADSINEHLDWINVMCYDYRGSDYKSKTSAPALLRDRGNPNNNMTTCEGLNAWITAGIDRKKLVMGLPYFGWIWMLKNSKVKGIGALTEDWGSEGQTTWTYAEVENFMAENNIKKGTFDKDTVSAYCSAGTTWIGYDNDKSVGEKVTYARDEKLGGYFFWQVHCNQNWKLTEAASRAWNGQGLKDVICNAIMCMCL